MTRLIEAWRGFTREQRLAALAAAGLFVAMFLHWYSKTDTLVVKGAAKSTQTSLNAFQAFSFVEAAVLLVSAGVIALLFGRAEGRNFNLPGGDGAIVTIAGGWASVLIFYRLLDKPGLHGNAKVTATVGVEWGIFVALLVALGLTYAGWRMRHGDRPGAPARRRPRPAGHSAGYDPAREQAAVDEVERGPRPARRSAPQDTAETALIAVAATPPRSEPREQPPAPAAPARPVRARHPRRPGEPEQLSFEDPPAGGE